MKSPIIFLLIVVCCTLYISNVEAQVSSTNKPVINRSCPFTLADTTALNLQVFDSLLKKDKLYRSYAVVFEFDKGVLCPVSFPFLDSVANYLKKNDSLVLRVSVHTDTRGSDKYSIKLSQRRAQSITDYLISKGIAANRLVAVGYQGTRPLISPAEIEKMKTKEEKEAAHQKNRRTEFEVLATGYSKN